MPETPVTDRDPHEWLTVEQVSNELGIHQVTVREWLRDGLLLGKKAGRRRWRVERRALQEFLDGGGSSEAAEEVPTPRPDRYGDRTEYRAAVIDTLSPRERSS